MKRAIAHLGGDERVNHLLKEFESDLQLIEMEGTIMNVATERAVSAPNDRVRAKASEISKESNKRRARLLDEVGGAIGGGRVSALMLSKIHQSKIKQK